MKHSRKKQKESLETRAVLLIFLFELEISGGGCTSKQRKMATFAKNCLVKMTLRLF